MSQKEIRGVGSGGSGGVPSLFQDSLSSDFELTGSDTTYTDTGLSVTVTLTEGQVVDIESVGTIWNQTTDNFSILCRLYDGTTEYDSWYHADSTSTTGYRVPYHLKYVGEVGVDLDPGEYTFTVQADNAQASNVDFKGTGADACRLYVVVYG